MRNICSREELVSFPEMKESYELEYAGYTPDKAAITLLKPLIKGTKIIIVMGTWCSDSRLHVPHFYKVLDAAGVTPENITLICVDAEKKADEGLIEDLTIEQVPTFIFTINNKETGRITESPETTLERDMVNILGK